MARIDFCRRGASELPVSVVAADEPTLTKDQIKQFLLNAKV